MTMFNENDTVIYTDADGRLIDTFVIFDTDATTGLTHINHQNLKVSLDSLQLHPNTVSKHHLPMRDAFSFELFKMLRDKYTDDKQAVERKLKVKSTLGVLAKAS